MKHCTLPTLFSCKKRLFYLPCRAAVPAKNGKNSETGKMCITPDCPARRQGRLLGSGISSSYYIKAMAKLSCCFLKLNYKSVTGRET